MSWQTFIRTARPRFLPDSPALNASSRRHIVTANGVGVSAVTSSTATSVPARSIVAPALAPALASVSSVPDDVLGPPATDDPYGDLAGLDFGNGGAGTGGGYETDMPLPRGAEEDLLF